MTTDPDRSGPTPGYAAASAELTQILREIENGQIDLDLLAEKVERAAALLVICRERLQATATKVRRITAEIDPQSDTDASAPGAAP